MGPRREPGHARRRRPRRRRHRARARRSPRRRGRRPRRPRLRRPNPSAGLASCISSPRAVPVSMLSPLVRDLASALASPLASLACPWRLMKKRNSVTESVGSPPLAAARAPVASRDAAPRRDAHPVRQRPPRLRPGRPHAPRRVAPSRRRLVRQGLPRRTPRRTRGDKSHGERATGPNRRPEARSVVPERVRAPEHHARVRGVHREGRLSHGDGVRAALAAEQASGERDESSEGAGGRGESADARARGGTRA